MLLLRVSLPVKPSIILEINDLIGLCLSVIFDENTKTMQGLIQDKITELEELCRVFDVKTLHVFGSACTDKFNEASDIDILVSFKDISIEKYTDNYFDLHYKLEELFNRKIDLLTERSLSNPYLIESIEETKELLYAA